MSLLPYNKLIHRKPVRHSIESRQQPLPKTESLDTVVAYETVRLKANDHKASLQSLQEARSTFQRKPITSCKDLLLTEESLAYVVDNHYQREFKKAGQRKLFCNELLLLCCYGYDKRPMTVVYAGAAPGHHLAETVKLFPQIKWELYDTRELAVSHPRITFHQQLFTDADAVYWSRKRNVLFISDIRSVGFKNSDKYAIERSVAEDMEMQQRWVEIIRPCAACLKFRLPYVAGYGQNVSVEYLPGDLYTQPWAGGTSTEGRLIVRPKDYGRRVEYDAGAIENRFFYHNNVRRVLSDYDEEAYNWLLGHITTDVPGLLERLTAAGL